VLFFFVVICPSCLGNPILDTISPMWRSYENPSGEKTLVGLLVFAALNGLIISRCTGRAIVQLRRCAGVATARPTGKPRGSPVQVVDALAGWLPDPVAGFVLDFEVSDRAHLPESTASVDIIPRQPSPVGADGLLWKELNSGRHFRLPRLWPLLWKSLPLMAVGLLLIIQFILATARAGISANGLGEFVQPFFRIVSGAGGGILLVLVSLSAALRVSRERERRTLDMLLMVPRERAAVLFSKWLGSVLSVRGPLVGLVAFWFLGYCLDSLALPALFLLAAAWLVYAGFLACVGLWFSTVCRSSLRAMLYTLLVTVLLLSPGGVLPTRLSSLSYRQADADEGGWNKETLLYGLSPFEVCWTFSFRSADLRDRINGPPRFDRIAGGCAGLYLYLAASAALFGLTLVRLRSEQGPRARKAPPKASVEA
jgi:ABC-type transport system involved in multi-copper enzyme maturation permease subunit